LRRYAELSSGQFRELADRAVFIVPVGSVEQHCEGPLGTDLMIAEAVSEAACEHLERSRASTTFFRLSSVIWAPA